MASKTLKMEIREDISVIQNMKNEKPDLFEPYINSIRFPKYKKIQPNARIDFDYPLTILVGKNGTNKTSILQALYSVKEGNALGNYWFTTEVDSIDANNQKVKVDRQAVIYSYFHKGAQRVVEVLQTRVKKKNNPDYWETSRPVQKYGMEIVDRQEYIDAKNEAKTRWDLVDKNVVYYDFKTHLSAYDMIFYHLKFKPSKTNKTIQDLIRFRSKDLAIAINKDLSSFIKYKNERILSNKILDNNQVKWINQIMETKYEKIRIITHGFYTESITKPLKTIYLYREDLHYSEAVAGSGESRLVLLVNQIMEAPNNSLILIDEPDLNLHPQAVKHLQLFLLEMIKSRKHQIVVSTHSKYLIDELPPSAIKLLSTDEKGQVRIQQNICPEDAFSEVGGDIPNTYKIYVEDDLSKEIVEWCLEKYMDPRGLNSMIEVRVLSGGCSSILVYSIPQSFAKGETKTFYILDGDADSIAEGALDEYSKYIENGKISQSLIPESDNRHLKDILKQLSRGDIHLPLDGGSDLNTENNHASIRREYLDYWKKHVFFLNSSSPERALFESSTNTDLHEIFNENQPNEDMETDNMKYVFEKFAQKLFGKNDSARILAGENLLINQLEDTSDLVKRVNHIIEEIYNSRIIDVNN